MDDITWESKTITNTPVFVFFGLLLKNRRINKSHFFFFYIVFCTVASAYIRNENCDKNIKLLIKNILNELNLCLLFLKWLFFKTKCDRISLLHRDILHVCEDLLISWDFYFGIITKEFLVICVLWLFCPIVMKHTCSCQLTFLETWIVNLVTFEWVLHLTNKFDKNACVGLFLFYFLCKALCLTVLLSKKSFFFVLIFIKMDRWMIPKLKG